LLGLASAPSYAQGAGNQNGGTLPVGRGAAVQRACRPELANYCPGVGDIGAVVKACLRQYYVNLSLACRAAIEQGAQPSGEAAGAGDEGQVR
jgi:hypothetical protein